MSVRGMLHTCPMHTLSRELFTVETAIRTALFDAGNDPEALRAAMRDAAESLSQMNDELCFGTKYDGERA